MLRVFVSVYHPQGCSYSIDVSAVVPIWTVVVKIVGSSVYLIGYCQPIFQYLSLCSSHQISLCLDASVFGTLACLCLFVRLSICPSKFSFPILPASLCQVFVCVCVWGELE